MTCATCHGQKAEGMLALGAPALADQEPYYLKQQLNNCLISWDEDTLLQKYLLGVALQGASTLTKRSNILLI